MEVCCVGGVLHEQSLICACALFTVIDLDLSSSSRGKKKPSMASRREKELRRRPVRGGEEVPAFEREVEISEIAEDEDEESYADDPLVLKGSRRPAEPPKEPAVRAERISPEL